jgi:hypothetical protein
VGNLVATNLLSESNVVHPRIQGNIIPLKLSHLRIHIGCYNEYMAGCTLSCFISDHLYLSPVSILEDIKKFRASFANTTDWLSL